MTNASVYLDSSALVKLVFDEDESAELWQFLRQFAHRSSSVIGRVEVLRVARLATDDLVLRHARGLLEHIHLVDLSPSIVSRAVFIEPPSIRSLDAIHLATALSLEPDLSGMVVYDKRLADAARNAGLTVFAPA